MRFRGKEQIQVPLFQQVTFQAPGVRCLRALVILQSLCSSSQLLVPPQGMKPPAERRDCCGRQRFILFILRLPKKS